VAQAKSRRPALTHLDAQGAARMVNVGEKPVTERRAVAVCLVTMSEPTLEAVKRSQLKKGDALQVARVAGIMAAKRTPDLIPLCHPLPISAVEVVFEFVPRGIRVMTTVQVTARTGVEMEALTAAAVAGLTLIDMVKGVEREAAIESVGLLEKSGGRSGTWKRKSHAPASS
jgi:cyclic pyranopterin phosphate synthase